MVHLFKTPKGSLGHGLVATQPQQCEHACLVWLRFRISCDALPVMLWVVLCSVAPALAFVPLVEGGITMVPRCPKCMPIAM